VKLERLQVYDRCQEENPWSMLSFMINPGRIIFICLYCTVGKIVQFVVTPFHLLSFLIKPSFPFLSLPLFSFSRFLHLSFYILTSPLHLLSSVFCLLTVPFRILSIPFYLLSCLCRLLPTPFQVLATPFYLLTTPFRLLSKLFNLLLSPFYLLTSLTHLHTFGLPPNRLASSDVN